VLAGAALFALRGPIATRVMRSFAARAMAADPLAALPDGLHVVLCGAGSPLHEALASALVGILTEAATAAGRSAVAKVTTDILDYHTSPVEAAQTAQQAGARHLLLYHVVPPLLIPGIEAAFLDGVSDAYSGPVTLGRDGTRVSLPPGSTAIGVSGG
jgi:hypothetical protein